MTSSVDFAAQYDRLVLDPFMREYFGSAGYFNAGYWDEKTKSQEEACRNLVDRLIARLPARIARGLDVGCGLGATTERFGELRPNARIFGLNLSFHQLVVCRTRCPGAVLLQADAARIGLASGCQDAILSVEAAFHFSTRADFIQEAARVLKPGGTLVLSDIIFKPEAWPGAWTVPAENNLGGVEAYRDLLETAGFEKVEIEDATKACWTGFCRSLEDWLCQKRSYMEDSARRLWNQVVNDLPNAVEHYLLVSAVNGKPGA